MKKDPPSNETKPGGAKAAMDRLEQHAINRSRADGGSDASGSEPVVPSSNLRRFTGMGVEFLGVILLFGLVGQWLDNRYHWHGLATVVAITIAAIGDMYLQIKLLLKPDTKAPPIDPHNQDTKKDE